MKNKPENILGVLHKLNKINDSLYALLHTFRVKTLTNITI